MANGYRLSKSVNGLETRYIWDNGNIVAELNDVNVISQKYYRGYNLICDDSNNYYMHDSHGNVIEIYQGNNNYADDWYIYNAFGTNKYFDDTCVANKWGYCDQLRDFETGNYYMRARYYNPESGRFISEDPIKDGVNWYSYCAGNPVYYIDDDGLAPKPIRDLMLGVDKIVSVVQIVKGTYDTRGKNLTDIVNGVWKDKRNLIPDISNSLGYDLGQNVFYYKNDTFQKGLGYTNTYDYASVFLGINIDQRIFNFEYDGKNWRIELWKGNYNIEIGLAGGEVGVYYNTDGSSYYSCVEPSDYLNIKLVIRSKNGKSFVCDTRYTWWQTGFQFGNTSLPYELKLYTEIQFKDREMFNAFIKGFNSMSDKEKKGVTICENSQANTINITWDYK